MTVVLGKQQYTPHLRSAGSGHIIKAKGALKERLADTKILSKQLMLCRRIRER